MIVLKNYFSPGECFELIKALEEKVKPWKPSLRKTIKTAEISAEEFPWYHEKLNKLVIDCNKIFEFDINGLTDVPAIVRYDRDSFFSWHDDTHSGRPGVYRKFSIIAVLSDPSSYAGGNLHFFDHGDQNAGKPPSGTVFVFPSWLQHKVDRVTAGTRYSTVAFVGSDKQYR